MNFSSRSLLRVVLPVALAFGASRALAARPLGTDVSAYQPSINWTTVKNAGVQFAIAKATEGTSWTSSYFVPQMTGASGVGIPIGAYHFARPSSNPGTAGADAEAEHFWKIAGPYITPGGRALVPMLDWEDTGATVAAGFTSAQMDAWVIEWCNVISNKAYAQGVIINPLIYTGAWYSKPSGTYPGLSTSTAITVHPCCISVYPTTPDPQNGGPTSTQCYPWTSCNFWQYADTNWSGGDSDVYMGTFADLMLKWSVGNTSGPVNFTATPGTPATFKTATTTPTPINYKWFSGNTLIPGATLNTYTIPTVQPSQAGPYSVVISNVTGIRTNSFYLTVLTNAPNSAVSPTGIVNWWPGDGTAADIAGGYSGIPHGTGTYVAGHAGGRAFHFGGTTNGYMTTWAPSIPVPWTASFWVNRQGNATGAALTGDGNSEVKIEQYNNTHQVGFTMFGTADYTFGYTAPVGTWTHLALVASAHQILLYANGVQVGSIATNAPLPRAYFGLGYVGSNGNLVDTLNANVDEIMMFNRALSASEVSILAANSFVRAPEITGIQRTGPTQFRLDVRGIPGKNITVYNSVNFVNWIPLGTTANASGTTSFTDNSATIPFKVYRAMSLAP